MRVLVVGAGGIGCYYGALLARAGHAVTLVGRAALAAAVADAGGLRIESPSFTGTVPVRVRTTLADGAADADLVLVCVKSGDTESVTTQLLHADVRSDATVVSFQNGIDNATRLGGMLGRTVVPAVLYVAVQVIETGHVRHHGGGDVLLGRCDHGEAIQAAFADAGVTLRISDAVHTALWDKLIINCVYNALSAIPDLPYGELVRRPFVDALMRDVIEECLAVARADRISGLADPYAGVARIARTMSGQRSSTAQDLRAGRRTEIDHLNGYVVRRGQTLGVATPVNRALQVLVHLMEQPGAQRPS